MSDVVQGCTYVDGMVFFECDRELMSGDFVSVKITGSTEYDLMGIMEENV